MNSEEIIDMAIQAGASPDENKIWLMYAEEIEAFAKLVAAREREACAKLCAARLERWVKNIGKDKMYQWMKGLPDLIRARGEQA